MRISYPKPVSITLWLTCVSISLWVGLKFYTRIDCDAFYRTEIAVIAADIPEVIGTAMALNILFGLPLWAGVLITGVDTLLFLAINLFGIRMLELLIGVLVGVISICFVVEMFMAGPPALEVLSGFIPKLDFAQTDQVYTAVSLLGAVVMPHNLFLHSALVRVRSGGPLLRGDVFKFVFLPARVEKLRMPMRPRSRRSSITPSSLVSLSVSHSLLTWQLLLVRIPCCPRPPRP